MTRRPTVRAPWAPACVVCVALGVASLTPPASARAPAKARLSYTLGAGASDCPSRNLLRDAVKRRLGYDPFDPAAGPEVAVELAAAGPRLTASVRFLDAQGQQTGLRVVEAAGAYCLELVDVVALAVSLALDPVAAQRAHRPRRGREPETPVDRRGGEPGGAESAADGSTAAALDPAALATVPPVLGGALYLDLLVALGAAPAPSVGLVVGGALRSERWSIGLELRADLPASKAAAGARVATHLVVGSLLPCVHFGPLAGCAVVSAGAVFARAAGFEGARGGESPFVAGGARAAFEWPLFGDGAAGSLAIRVSAELLFPVTRSALWLGDREVWSTPPATGSGAVGLGWHF